MDTPMGLAQIACGYTILSNIVNQVCPMVDEFKVGKKMEQ